MSEYVVRHPQRGWRVHVEIDQRQLKTCGLNPATCERLPYVQASPSVDSARVSFCREVQRRLALRRNCRVEDIRPFDFRDLKIRPSGSGWLERLKALVGR